jgi:hypothetical protein
MISKKIFGGLIPRDAVAAECGYCHLKRRQPLLGQEGVNVLRRLQKFVSKELTE